MIDEIVTEACENQVNSETLDAFEAAVDIFNYIQQQDVFLGYDTAAELDKHVSGWLQVLNNNAELHLYRHHVSEAVCVYNGFLKLNKTLIFQCQCKKTIQKIREHFPDTGPTPSASSDDLVESIIGEMMEQSETGNSFRSRLFECGNCIRRSKCPRNQVLAHTHILTYLLTYSILTHLLTYSLALTLIQSFILTPLLPVAAIEIPRGVREGDQVCPTKLFGTTMR